MLSYLEEQQAHRKRVRKRWIWLTLLVWLVGMGLWQTNKPMPPGTNVASQATTVSVDEVEFLYDLTFADAFGQQQYEQRIFDEVFRIIDEAQAFIVTDFFLVNELMGAANNVHRPLSRQLVERLIARKREKPELTVLFITDPINEVYGGTQSALLTQLRAAGIDVVTTNLQALRDSNPGYSAIWRTFVQLWGNNASNGWMPNPFGGESKVTLRSWLALLNFKANHRKLIIADRADGALVGLVTSANPHDASSAHSNVALRFTGETARQMLESEMAIARVSGWGRHIYVDSIDTPSTPSQDSVQLRFVTEQAIETHLVEHIASTRKGDRIDIATFYLSDRGVIGALLDAANRGVRVRLILDANRDAFGRQKDGVPNRPVANELVTQSKEAIEVRWVRTHGEQFHTKLALIARGDELVASLGSANLTRRNLDAYNLEANVAVTMKADSPMAVQLNAYFNRLWSNEGPPGTEYTAPFGAFRDETMTSYWRYRLMEATGLSTF
jgi:phosphatidylserine/phosphatidylglycerophosphate/cardiolipin synthase-like enzyme